MHAPAARETRAALHVAANVWRKGVSGSHLDQAFGDIGWEVGVVQQVLKQCVVLRLGHRVEKRPP